MGIFDKFKGQSGNQADEEQQGGPQDSGMGGYQDPNQPGYQDPTQGGYQDQDQDQNQGDQSGYDPTRISTGTRTRASKPASIT